MSHGKNIDARPTAAEIGSGRDGLGADPGNDPVADTQSAYITLLFNKYRGSLHRYLQSLVSSPDDAAELAQESYFRLLRHGNIQEFEALARSYLFQTATNLARDHLRQRISQRASSHCPIEDCELAAAASDCPEEQLAWQQTLGAIQTAIVGLPAATRTIYLLNHFRGLSHAEIAKVLGISLRSVERKMAEAIALLAAHVRSVL